LGDFEPVVEPFEPRRTRVAHTEVVDFEANWKTAAENFNECYHCAGTHPSLCRATDVPRMQLEAPTWFEEDPDGVSAGGDAGMPLNPGYRTLSIDGGLISSVQHGSMGETDAEVGRNVGLNLLPNYFYAGFYVDHWWAQMIWPISTTRSRMTFKWYVHEDAVEGVDYDVANLVKVMQTTYLEDVDLIEHTYRGVASRTYEPGPIVAKNEPLMLSYVRSYYSLMGRDVDGSRRLEP
jgi:Rieske 2Fe-2S family protein